MRWTWNRRALPFCATVLVSALVCPCLAIAGGSEDVQLRIRDTVAFAGGDVAVPVTMDASPRPSSIAFWIEYDESKLSFQDAEPGLVLTLAGKDVSWDFPAPGRVSFLIFGLNDTRIAAGKILTLKFDVDSDVQPGTELLIDGLNESATDPEADPLDTEIEGGTIDILQCFQPGMPTNFSATDGLFPGYVQLTWTPVFGAQSYVIYRNEANDPSTATILASTVLPFYTDTTAQGAQTLGGGGGCSGGGGQSLNFTTYYYWILAQNLCGQSALTAAESGYRGELKAARTTRITIDALPDADITLEPEIELVDVVEAGIVDFEESVGAAYKILPEGSFVSPVTIQLPAPKDVEPSELIPYYYVDAEGWFPGSHVDGWLEPGSVSVVDTGTGKAVEFVAHHGGIVRLGYVAQSHVPAGLGTVSSTTPLAIAGLVLGLMSRRPRGSGSRL